MKELIEKLKMKGYTDYDIYFDLFFYRWAFQLFVLTADPARSKYYADFNSKILEQALIEVDYLRPK